MEKTRALTKILNASVSPERYVVFALLCSSSHCWLCVLLSSVVVFNIVSFKERSFEKTENDSYHHSSDLFNCCNPANLITLNSESELTLRWTPFVFENGQLGPCRKRPGMRWHIRLEVNSTVPWVSHHLAIVRYPNNCNNNDLKFSTFVFWLRLLLISIIKINFIYNYYYYYLYIIKYIWFSKLFY